MGEDTKEVCGNCYYHRFNNDIGEFTCRHKDSDNYGLETEYNDSCDDWYERD